MTLADRVGAALGTTVHAARPVTGGDLNDAWRMDLADGGAVFVKTPRDAPAGTSGAFAAEAAGLRWLGDAGALPVPAVRADGEDFLVLEWVDPGRLDAAGEEALGRGLARLHAAGAPGWGWMPASPPTLRLGAVALADVPAATWAEVYGERFLAPLARHAVERGALDAAGAALVDRLCARLEDLADPAEPPARLHGDLWSGNVLADRAGRPWLVDPAAYGGHREVDLAMLRFFGGPSERCFAAYAEVAPLADGHEDRVALWQVFPLLVHAVLFGGGYGARAVHAARRYV